VARLLLLFLLRLLCVRPLERVIGRESVRQIPTGFSFFSSLLFFLHLFVGLPTNKWVN